MKATNYMAYTFFQDNNIKKNMALMFNTRNSRMIAIDRESFQVFKDNPEKLSNTLKKKMIKYDFLTEKEEGEELTEVIRENRQASKNGELLYIVIQPTAYCQLACNYCGQDHKKEHLTNYNEDLLIKFIENKISKHSPKKLMIGWFGSEPLYALSTIVSLSRRLKRLCEGQNIKYASKVVTNGVNLTARTALILEEEANCQTAEITLDGDISWHDQRRHTKNNRPTFEIIYKNLKNVLNRIHGKMKITIRCNIDASNKEGVLPLLERLKSDNLHKKITYLYMAPIHSWGNDAHKMAAEKEKFAAWEIDCLVWMNQLGFNLNLLPKRKKNLCMATESKSYLVDPYGGVFGCTEVSLVPSYMKDGTNIHQIGHIQNFGQDTSLQKNKFSDFYPEILKKQYDCHDCNMLPICGGMCPKEWSEGRIPCPSTKFNIKERMIFHYILERDYLEKKAP